MPDQEPTHSLQDVALVEPTADHGLDSRQRPPLIRPVVRDRALRQLPFQRANWAWLNRG
jgi:hypothetical protein